jgi:N,N'-diacetyllegionaminate synthase
MDKKNNIFKFSDKNPALLIAEIGMNHNGDVGLGMEMIRSAADSGADVVKFQTFNTGDFLSKEFPDYDTRKKHELSKKDHEKLFSYAIDCGIDFLSTPFDHDSVDMLCDIGVGAFKIASADLTNTPLLNKVIRTGKPIILSTGYSTTSEIFEAYELLLYGKENSLCIMHCVASYPTQDIDVNLLNIVDIKSMFKNAIVGFSDHSLDSDLIPPVAVSLGAKVIEKHFTLDRNLEGYDHHMSLTPDMFSNMRDSIRRVEVCMGSSRSESGLIASENERKVKAGRSLYWSRDIKKGEKIQESDFIPMRPGGGVSVDFIDKLQGLKLRCDIAKGKLVEFVHLV